MRTHFPKKSYDEVTEGLLQGPKQKKQSTIDLENIGRAFLDPNQKVSCQFNALGELEVKVNDRIYNLTLILADNPDFEHMEFSPEEVANYAKFLQTAELKPELHGKELPSTEDYKALDPTGKHDHMLYGEKLAITLYTGDSYEPINDFLRGNGKTDELRSLVQTALTQNVKEIVLATVIASQALNKIPNTPIGLSTEAQQDVYRYEETVDKLDLSRENDIAQQKTTLHKSFTSTANASILQKIEADITKATDTKHTIIQYWQPGDPQALGKNIQELAQHNKEEGEVLFAPGVEFKYYAASKEPNITTFVAVPVRTYQQYTNNQYVSSSASLHSEVLQFADQLSKDSDSAVNDLAYLKHLTESNDNQNDSALESARKEIDAIIAAKTWMDDHQELIATAQLAYENHLSHRFADLNLNSIDADEKFGSTTIERPNHGLAHSIRPTVNLLSVIQYYANFAKDEKFRKFSASLTSQDIELLQKALLFFVTGRESELNFKQNIDAYIKYREASFNNFANWARSNNIPEEKIEEFRSVLSTDRRHYDEMGVSHSNPQFIFNILILAHRLDSFRYENAEDFIDILQKADEKLVTSSQQQKQAKNNLLSIATNSIEQTGDRLTCKFDGTEIVSADKKRDGKRFVPASQNAAVSFQTAVRCTARVEPAVIQTNIAKPTPISDEKLIEWMMLASQSGYSELFNKLLAEANQRHLPMKDLSLLFNPNNLTEENLLSAVERNQANIVSLMLHTKPSLLSVQTDGMNLLHMAAANGSADVVDTLLKNNHFSPDDLTQQGMSALHLAALNNNLKVIDVLLSHGADINIQNSQGASPLISCVQYHTQAAAALIENGADIDFVEMKTGKTALIYAIEHDNSEAVILLMEKNANVNVQELHGMTALHYAAYKGDEELVSFLITKGADVNTQDNEGKTPLSYAKNTEVVVSILLALKPTDLTENDKKSIQQNAKSIADEFIFRLQSSSREEQLALWEQAKNAGLQTIFSNAYQQRVAYSPSLFNNNSSTKPATVYDTILDKVPIIKAHESNRLKM